MALGGTTLVLAERASVEIDYCPQRRGDRGELDRIDRRHDDDHFRGGRYEQPRRKRGGAFTAFTALTDLLGGGGD